MQSVDLCLIKEDDNLNFHEIQVNHDLKWAIYLYAAYNMYLILFFRFWNYDVTLNSPVLHIHINELLIYSFVLYGKLLRS